MPHDSTVRCKLYRAQKLLGYRRNLEGKSLEEKQTCDASTNRKVDFIHHLQNFNLGQLSIKYKCRFSLKTLKDGARIRLNNLPKTHL